MDATPPLDYRRCARRSFFHYALLAFGLLFASVIFTVDPARHCVEGPCPFWLRAIVSGVGFVLATGAVNALWRNWQWGSRVEADALVWWDGAPPAAEHRLPISRIASLRYDTSSESNDLYFLDADGKKLFVPPHCLPSPLAKWAEAFVARFPGITLTRDD